jgi:hypothetical protein
MEVIDPNAINPPGGETSNAGKAPDLLVKWQGWIKISKEDKEKKKAEIKRGRELYSRKVDHNERLSGNAGAVSLPNPPNFAKMGVDLIVDQVYERNPKVIAKARAPVYITSPDPVTGMVTQIDVSEQRTEIIQEVLNHELKASSLKGEMKAAIRSSHIVPEAWIQVGYQFDEEAGTDGIFFRYRSIDVMFPDPRMQLYEGVIRRCRFIALKWEITADEAKDMGIDPAILERNSCSKNPDTETKTYEVFHMWDITNKTMGFVTESGSEFPSQPAPWPWQISGFPFVPLRFSENPDERWAKAPIIEVEGIQIELDDQRETMNQHIINARPVKLYDATLDDTQINTLAGRDKGSWVKVVGLQQTQNQIQVFNDDELPRQFFDHYERNKGEMADILHYRQADLLQPTGMTATESQDIARKAANQIGSKIDVLEDCFRKLIRLAKEIIEQTYTTDRMTEISGQDGNKFWVRWTGSMLNDTDVDIEVGSVEKEDSTQQLQVSLNMLGTMMKVQGMNVIELALDVLKRSDYRDVNKYRMGPPPGAPVPPNPQLPPPGAPPAGVATNPNVTPGGIAGQINPSR